MIKKCDNGHWYDANINSVCPYCKLASEKLRIDLNDIVEDDHTVSITEAGLSLGEELDSIISRASKALTSDPNDKEVDGDKTISFGFFGISALQPVTGWLVCVTGIERGKDFRLHAGKNFIGRSTTMDIVLVDDKKISRKKHCSVIYEPNDSLFYLSPEEGNTVYLNDQLLKSSEKLKENDKIMVGDTSLIFIPFNREDRKWEEE